MFTRYLTLFLLISITTAVEQPLFVIGNSNGSMALTVKSDMSVNPMLIEVDGQVPTTGFQIARGTYIIDRSPLSRREFQLFLDGEGPMLPVVAEELWKDNAAKFMFSHSKRVKENLIEPLDLVLTNFTYNQMNVVLKSHARTLGFDNVNAPAPGGLRKTPVSISVFLCCLEYMAQSFPDLFGKRGQVVGDRILGFPLEGKDMPQGKGVPANFSEYVVAPNANGESLYAVSIEDGRNGKLARLRIVHLSELDSRGIVPATDTGKGGDSATMSRGMRWMSVRSP
jgi:hypothetical protein